MSKWTGLTTMGSKHHLNPIVVFFLKSKFFHFQKNLQVLADPVVVIFFKKSKKITSVGSSAFQKKLQQLDQPILDPTLVLFLTSFEKNTTTGSSANFLSP